MFVMMVTSGWGPETQRLGELCGYLSRRRNICSSVLGPVAGTSAANFYSCVTQTCTTCNNPRHPIQYAINTVLFSPTPLASSTDIVQMCRSSKQQLKGEQRHMMDNQFAKLPAIVPMSRGRHVSRGAQPRHVTSHILQRRGSGG